MLANNVRRPAPADPHDHCAGEDLGRKQGDGARGCPPGAPGASRSQVGHPGGLRSGGAALPLSGQACYSRSAARRMVERPDHRKCSVRARLRDCDLDDIREYKKHKWAELQEQAKISLGTAASGFGSSEMSRLMGIIERQHADYKAVIEYRDALVAQINVLNADRDYWLRPIRRVLPRPVRTMIRKVLLGTRMPQ